MGEREIKIGGVVVCAGEDEVYVDTVCGEAERLTLAQAHDLALGIVRVKRLANTKDTDAQRLSGEANEGLVYGSFAGAFTTSGDEIEEACEWVRDRCANVCGVDLTEGVDERIQEAAILRRYAEDYRELAAIALATAEEYDTRVGAHLGLIAFTHKMRSEAKGEEE